MTSDDLSWLEAVDVGLLQGVATVFPISGDGHAVLIGALPGAAGAHLDPSAAPSLYAALRLAVALGLVTYYWRDWITVIRGITSTVVRPLAGAAERRWAWLVAIASVPPCVAVALLAGRARPLLHHPRLAAGVLLVTGVLMVAVGAWWRRSPRSGGMSGAHRARVAPAERARIHAEELSALPADGMLVLGAAQLGALVPGGSPVALVLVLGLVLGLTHEQAAHVALLLLTPFLLTRGLADLPRHALSSTRVVGAAVLAAAAAFAAAVLLRWYFARAPLRPFGWYCVVAGAVSLAALVLT